jgi:hypothetical protein
LVHLHSHNPTRIPIEDIVRRFDTARDVDKFLKGDFIEFPERFGQLKLHDDLKFEKTKRNELANMLDAAQSKIMELEGKLEKMSISEASNSCSGPVAVNLTATPGTIDTARPKNRPPKGVTCEEEGCQMSFEGRGRTYNLKRHVHESHNGNKRVR